MTFRLPQVRSVEMQYDFFRYTLQLADGRPREGILLRLENSNGAVGWGDAAPLPSWSQERFEDVMECIQAGPPWQKVPSSLACALEAASASLVDPQKIATHGIELPLNALLDGDFNEIRQQSRLVLERGCRCLKIKTSLISMQDIPSLLNQICSEAENRCRIRIDPNRSWDFDETLRLANELRDLPIDYIEEPLRDSSKLPDLIQQSPVGIALDETLREIAPDHLPRFRGAVALVLKPTLMGGFEASRQFASAGLEAGMTPVVSACYESGVGIYALGKFALSLPRISPAGLDTYSRLAQDVLCERLDLDNFVFNGNSPLPDVDISKLHPL